MLPVDRKKLAQAYSAAMALQKAGRLDEARARLDALEKIAPSLAEVPFQLGRIALAQKAPDRARQHLEHAKSLKPDEPAILAALADTLGRLGQTEAAAKLYDQVIQAQPKAVKPRADKAVLLQRAGDFDGAEREFRRALKLAPKDGELYRMFLATKTLTKGDPLIRAMEQAWSDKALPPRSRINLGFALAKAMEDTGRSDRVFRYLNSANAAQRSAWPFDMADRRQEVDGLIEAFSGADFAPAPGAPDEVAPIFVTGPPRSGTTLVERILAAHRQVTGGGEMGHGLALAYGLIGRPGHFQRLETVNADEVAGFGRAYGEAVRAQHSFDRVITDKSIQSHLILGLLAKALPAARFIVVRRDPRDMGLSIYKNMFADGTHRYATSLEDIAAYIGSFERMMTFWRASLPDRFTEIAYEDLVADPEAQSRGLVAAAGLDWDPACLEPHRAEGRVETLSLAQVRQPIHQGRARAWGEFADDLAPLIAALKREGVPTDGA